MTDQSAPVPLTHPLLSAVRHGFFTRAGGVSGGLYASLNCGPGSQDDPAAVRANRARVAGTLGIAPDRLLTLSQVHSADVVTVDGPHQDAPHRDAPHRDSLPRADAMVTATPGLALGILTADCQPVLFADVTAGVIGAAHAGWRGTAAGVIEATVAAMMRLGAVPAQIVAVIGPTIGPGAYEIGPDFRDSVLAADPSAAPFFVPGPQGRDHFDLPAYGLDRLARAGVGRAVWTGDCTYSDPARFFSFRRTTHRSEPDYGRLIAAIRL